MGTGEGDDIAHRAAAHTEDLTSPLKPGCRFMCDTTDSRWVELERRNQRFIAALVERDPGFDPSKLTLYASQGRVWAVGRICCDAESASGRLNDKSVILEGCLRPCQGLRVRLDLRNIPEFSLFPGQVVAVEGDNPSGYCLVASRIITSLPPSPPPTPTLQDPSRGELQLKKPRVGLEDGRLPPRPPSLLKMILAAGPYTTSDNWRFEPLQGLLKRAAEDPPDVLMLVGPFVDSEHPDVKSGTCAEDFGVLFRERVLRPVETLRLSCQGGNAADARPMSVLWVPSTRDALHDPVFPQPPFGEETVGDASIPTGDGCHMFLGNPAVALLNSEMAVACTSTDVLRHLSSEEISRLGALHPDAPPPEESGPVAECVPRDRLSRLCWHLLGQRSFYPLFPSPAGACLDLSLSPLSLQLPLYPHLLVLPSDLAPFSKVVESSVARMRPAQPVSGAQGGAVASDPEGGESLTEAGAPSARAGPKTLCVNPGRLAKGTGGGTFARLRMVADAGSSVVDTAQVDMLRIELKAAMQS